MSFSYMPELFVKKKKLQQVSNPHLTLQDIEKDLGSIHFGESLTHEVEKSVMV